MLLKVIGKMFVVKVRQPVRRTTNTQKINHK